MVPLAPQGASPPRVCPICGENLIVKPSRGPSPDSCSKCREKKRRGRVRSYVQNHRERRKEDSPQRVFVRDSARVENDQFLGDSYPQNFFTQELLDFLNGIVEEGKPFVPDARYNYFSWIFFRAVRNFGLDCLFHKIVRVEVEEFSSAAAFVKFWIAPVFIIEMTVSFGEQRVDFGVVELVNANFNELSPGSKKPLLIWKRATEATQP